MVARHFHFGTFDAAPSRGVHAITYTRVRKTGATSMCVPFGNVMNALWKMGHVRLKQAKYSSLIRFFNTWVALAREHTGMNIHHSQHTIGYVHHDNIECVFCSGEKLNRVPFLVFHLAQDVALDGYDCVMVVLRIKGYHVAFRVFNLFCD